MKSIDGMIACAAITGAVLLAPAQKLLKSAEGQLCQRTQFAFNAPLPPLPPVMRGHMVLQAIAPRVMHPVCPELEAKLAAEQLRLQSGLVRQEAEIQARAIAQQQVKAALAQVRWQAGSRGE